MSQEQSIVMFVEQVRREARVGGWLEAGWIDYVVLNAGVLEYPGRISEV